MTENHVQMVWGQKEVIVCWFVTFPSFRAKWSKFFTDIFFSHSDGKQ